MRGERDKIKSELQNWKIEEVELGRCLTCSAPVKIIDVKNHLRHVKVEKIIERVTQADELKKLEDKLDAVEEERDRPRMEKVKLEKERSPWVEVGTREVQDGK